jgi:hypothetical protein
MAKHKELSTHGQEKITGDFHWLGEDLICFELRTCGRGKTGRQKGHLVKETLKAITLRYRKLVLVQSKVSKSAWSTVGYVLRHGETCRDVRGELQRRRCMFGSELLYQSITIS